MAKKNVRASKKEQPAAASEPENMPVESSDSSESDFEVEGLAEPQESGKRTGHTVNLSREGKAAAVKGGRDSGVIYIGRLPDQFQEYEMKKYFAQFGTITKLRLSRNKNGRSRHYGFIEFKDKTVAQVAADTMNNYLLFGHLLKVQVVEQPRNDLFGKKAIATFREFDWRARDALKHDAPKPLDEWKELQAKFEESKKAHLAHLKGLGFDYELEA